MVTAVTPHLAARAVGGIRKAGDAALAFKPRPVPFDWQFLDVAANYTAVETILPDVLTPIPPVPQGMRGVIDQVDMNLYDAFGALLSPVVAMPMGGTPNSSVGARVQVYVSNRPQLLIIEPTSPSMTINDRPILELNQGDKINIGIANWDNTGAVVFYIGFRLRGRFLPFNTQAGGL